MQELNLNRQIRPEAFQTRISRLVRSAALRIAHSLSGTGIDLGCGNGLFILDCMADESVNIELFGLDYDIRSLINGHLLFRDNYFNPNRFVSGDFFNLPFANEYFDAVFCLNTLVNLHPFTKIANLISEMYRICKPGGKIILDYRNKHNPLLRLKYLKNIFTGRITTYGHTLGNFSEIVNLLNIKILEKIPLGHKFKITAVGFMLILEK
jgi:ubiquinone/menaquinone biosynthesis C-methylase UbiE